MGQETFPWEHIQQLRPRCRRPPRTPLRPPRRRCKVDKTSRGWDTARGALAETNQPTPLFCLTGENTISSFANPIVVGAGNCAGRVLCAAATPLDPRTWVISRVGLFFLRLSARPSTRHRRWLVGRNAGGGGRNSLTPSPVAESRRACDIQIRKPAPSPITVRPMPRGFPFRPIGRLGGAWQRSCGLAAPRRATS